MECNIHNHVFNSKYSPETKNHCFHYLRMSCLVTKGSSSSSTELPMLHRHVSTSSQNGQTKHLLYRGTFMFLVVTAGKGEGYRVGCNLQTHFWTPLNLIHWMSNTKWEESGVCAGLMTDFINARIQNCSKNKVYIIKTVIDPL